MTPTVLITGATSGIGLELARLYGARGARLILVGRRPLADLNDPLFTSQTYCQADLAQPGCLPRLSDFLAAGQVDRLDLLIHNAGIGYYGDFAGQTAVNIDELLAVNLLAPIRLTYALYAHLTAASGRVVFISSVATAAPTPEYAVYGATKAALEGFARSLRVEWRPHEWRPQIGVQIVRPGATRTAMHQKLGISREIMDWEKFPPADKTAAQIVQAIDRGRTATIGLGNQALTSVGRNARFLLDPLLRRRAAAKLTAVPAPINQPPLCAITGAADGIGKALARRFAQAGYAVIGIDVDAERAAAAAAELHALGAEATFIIADLSDDAGLALVVDGLRGRPPLDALIHNAGINAVGRFEGLDLAAQERVVALNLRAPLQLTAALRRYELLSEQASLIFLSSLSHYVSYPGAAVYAATKDGLAHYGRSLQISQPRGHTLVVFPGPTRTAHARRYSPDNSREATRMPPEKLAELIFQAARKRQARLVPGLGNRLIAFGGYLAPRLLEWSMEKAILAKLLKS
jgi:short-subunit dehydrogenase